MTNPTPLTPDELKALAYFAVGVTSEGSVAGRDVAYRLSFAGNVGQDGRMDPVGNSGYSFGTLQIDLGQHPAVAHELLDSFQRWAASQADRGTPQLSQRAYESTLEALQRTGRQMEAAGARDIDRAPLDRFLRSEAGKGFVHALDAQHVDGVSSADRVQGNRDTALERLQRTDLYRNASDSDQSELAAMFMKLQNQAGHGHWPGIMARVESSALDSPREVKTAIDGLLRNHGGEPDYIESGADNTLRGVGVFNALRGMSSANPLSTAWAHVMANPLVGPVQAHRADPANPNLGFEYETIRSLFLTPEPSRRFVQALDRGATLSEGDPQPANGRSQAGFYVSGNDFVHWNRNGQGQAMIDGQWRHVDVRALQRVRRQDGSVELRITEDGQTTTLLRVEPGMRPLRAAADVETPLSMSIRAGVAQLDARAGKAWDDLSDRMHAGLLLLARRTGFMADDSVEVAMGDATQRHAPGELVHLRRIGPQASPDPAANRAHALTADLLATPATESYEKASKVQPEQQVAATNQRLAQDVESSRQQGQSMRM
jgi:hypothetical protein